MAKKTQKTPEVKKYTMLFEDFCSIYHPELMLETKVEEGIVSWASDKFSGADKGKALLKMLEAANGDDAQIRLILPKVFANSFGTSNKLSSELHQIQKTIKLETLIAFINKVAEMHINGDFTKQPASIKPNRKENTFNVVGVIGSAHN